MKRGWGKGMNRTRFSGYMTVSVALVLTLGISLCLTLIEGCRRSTSVLVAECAVDTGMNSVLAEYHRELFRQYGLFFIDTSYGSDTPDYSNTLKRLQDYAVDNLGQQEKLLNTICEDFTDLHWERGEFLRLSVSSDDGGGVLRRQISEYMQEQLGVTYLKEVLDWMDLVEEHDLRGDWYENMESDAEKSLREWGAWEEPEEDGKEELSYFDELSAKLQEGALKLFLGLEDLSQVRISGEDLLSGRERIQGTGVNPAAEFEDSDGDRLLLQEYILEMTGRFGKEKTGSHLRYQTEYILCGMESDVENLSEMVNQLLTLREVANGLHILMSQEKMDFLQPIAEGVAAALGVPELSPAIQTLFVTLWAGFESLWDVGRLLAGEEIALIKNDAQWHYSLSVPGPETTITDGSGESGLLLDYEDYLRIFLMFQEKQTITYRLMDVMEMDIRLTSGNESFRMDGCVDSIMLRADLESGYGYKFNITRNYGY